MENHIRVDDLGVPLFQENVDCPYNVRITMPKYHEKTIGKPWEHMVVSCDSIYTLYGIISPRNYDCYIAMENGH